MIRAPTNASLATLVIFASLACSCQRNSAEHWERVPATIIRDMGIPPGGVAPVSESSVLVPLRAVAGQPIQVKVTSFGGGCNAQGSTTTELGDRVARIRVYDQQQVPDGKSVCTTELKRFTHQTSLVLPVAGTWRIEVIGLREGKGYFQGRPAVIKGSVVVQ